MIRYIQSKGLRVLILQRGAVEVWDREDPRLEWSYPNLEAAYEGVMELLGEAAA